MSAIRERRGSGSLNGYVSTIPPATIRSPSATAASRPGTWAAATPAAAISRPVAEPGPLKTWAPKLSHTPPHSSERIRPPTVSSASSTSTSRSRRCQAAASPASPAPTTTTSRLERAGNERESARGIRLDGPERAGALRGLDIGDVRRRHVERRAVEDAVRRVLAEADVLHEHAVGRDD